MEVADPSKCKDAPLYCCDDNAAIESHVSD